MVNQKLLDYIKVQINQGYSAQQLRNYLIQLGYTTIEVDEAIRFAQLSKNIQSKRLGVFQKLKLILAKPKFFFDYTKYEKGLIKPLIYFLLIGLLIALTQLITQIFSNIFSNPEFEKIFSIIAVIYCLSKTTKIIIRPEVIRIYDNEGVIFNLWHS